jgi:tetratricopeptide (TPR) repeat protein
VRIIPTLLAAAYVLCAQAARADMYSDCNNSCDPASQIEQCAKIAELPDAPPKTLAAANDRLCVTYFRMGIYERPMLEACRLAVVHEPTATRYANLGVAKITIRAYKSAIKSLKKGVALDPTLSVLYYDLAVAHDWRHERKAALLNAQQAQLLGDTNAHRLIKKLVRPQLPIRR